MIVWVLLLFVDNMLLFAIMLAHSHSAWLAVLSCRRRCRADVCLLVKQRGSILLLQACANAGHVCVDVPDSP